jgi:hypothetical protein
MRIIFILFAALALAASYSSEAAVVSTSEDVQKALLAAKGGETISLKPGTYGALTIKKGRPYQRPVTIRALDPANPPVFTQQMLLRDLENVVFRNLHFQASAGAKPRPPVVRVYGGRDLVFTDNLFQGFRDAEGHHGYGIMADGTARLTIRSNRFRKLNRGVVASRIRSFTAQRNDISDIGHDGFSLADIQDGEISGNLIEDFYPLPGYHPDGIQFHSGNQLASRDVLIQNNLIISAPDRRIQGIFMRSGYESDPTQRFRNIRILDNIVIGAMWNGIAVLKGDGLEIARNKVLHLPGNDRIKARLRVDEGSGRVEGNQLFGMLLSPGMVDVGNMRVPASTVAEALRIRAEWLARFRAQDRARAK